MQKIVENSQIGKLIGLKLGGGSMVHAF